MDSWKVMQQWYKERLGVSPIILDYIATYPVLEACALGKSVTTICREQDLDEQYVVDTLRYIYHRPGFKEDLGFNSKYLYQKYKYNHFAYYLSARTLDPETSEEDLKFSFEVNKIFEEIERKVQEYDRKA